MATSTAQTGAQPWVPDRLSLASLRSAEQECRGCDLYRDATQVVPGDGRRAARVMLVGEQPGDAEDRAGQPFVGPAGRLLVTLLDEAGFEERDVFLTNAVKHFRFEQRGKRRIHKSPTRTQMVACRPWLLAEMDLIQPDGVVLLGATAGSAVYGSSFRLGPHRGRLLTWPTDELPVKRPPLWLVATTHPAAVLRSRDRDADRAALLNDLQLAASAG